MSPAAGKQRLGVIFGGRSGEHEVSVVSAQHVMAAVDRDRFEVVPIGVTRTGAWLTPEETQAQMDVPAAAFKKTLTLPQAEGLLARQQALGVLTRIDVAFPLIHGPTGEDGTLQGLLELAQVPYVGAGVAASAVGLDKALMKALLHDAGLPVIEWLVVTQSCWAADPAAVTKEIEEALRYPCFVKPANGGSSVGITKAGERAQLAGGMAEAFRYDRKVILEKGVVCREIECAVLGNDDPEASPLGEIVHKGDFYDYAAKYLDPSTTLVIPAQVPEETASRIRRLAVAAFHAIDCAGMARVDFFLTPEGEVFADELNTVPGFTPGSMYPRLCQAAGVSYSELISRLVDLGLERFAEKEKFAQV
ncbi:MAG: D-alanine--D-alanine ligase family protein [Dehalococcoidia bacterium]|jgi:D-alanine-D-alanine ligase